MSTADLTGLPAGLPRIRRLLAPNPSPLTFRGTNSYILGSGRVAIIDPGPDDPRHLAALLGALALGEQAGGGRAGRGHLRRGFVRNGGSGGDGGVEGMK